GPYHRVGAVSGILDITASLDGPGGAPHDLRGLGMLSERKGNLCLSAQVCFYQDTDFVGRMGYQ
ncbi:hypothetical protein ACC848_42035, partial [Rhizobium johnstonii]